MSIRIGTAAWTIPREVRTAFPDEGSGLTRYAARFNAVEINSSFYRPHRPATYARWAASTPAEFRFSIKLPRAITHELRLAHAEARLSDFVGEIAALGDKLGPILVQLPPSLAFNSPVAARFFAALRALTSGPAVCEPRHSSWFGPEADALLTASGVARAAADPAPHPAAAAPGGWPGLAYWRLHGSPRMYYTPYSGDILAALARRLRLGPAAETWCIFDNTALGAATSNALALQTLMAPV
jgi:uncharacterized protein YecE (DUF72 family)